MSKPEVHAWFVDDPIDGDDPLAHIKQRAAVIWTAAEVLEQAARTGTAAARADRVSEVAALYADEAFDPHDVGDAARAAGMSEADLDSAGHVAVMLAEIETGGPQALPWMVPDSNRCGVRLVAAIAGEGEGQGQAARPGGNPVRL